MPNKKAPSRFIISIDDQGVHFSKLVWVHINPNHKQVDYTGKIMFSIESEKLKDELLKMITAKAKYRSDRDEINKLKKKVRRLKPENRHAAIKKWHEDRKKVKRKK